MNERLNISHHASARPEPRYEAANRAAIAARRAEARAAKDAAKKTVEAGGGRWVLPILLVAQLMVILDITAVNIALPSLARDLHISGATISWTITAYSLVFGSL